MEFTVFDLETDGFLKNVTKIHCLSYQIVSEGKTLSRGSLTDPVEIGNFLKDKKYLVCHNLVRYDLPVIRKILGIDLDSVLIDTLSLSWYLYLYRPTHNLEEWGFDLGFPKPEVGDWENLPIEVYIERCEADVEINTRLFWHMMRYLYDIYGDINEAIDLIQYLSFKMDCLRDQEEIGIKLDRKTVDKHLSDLEKEYQNKIEILQQGMPKELGKVLKKRPKMFKKDGSLSKRGEEWLEYIKHHDLDPRTEEHRELPNPGSTEQLKKWLFSLGWVPATLEESKSTGEMIPKVSLPWGQGLCPSVKLLFDIEPVLEELEGLFMIRHRIGVFKSFIKNQDDDWIFSSAHGFTNTLRLKHSQPLANLPKPDKFYGEEIRQALTIPNKEEFLMVGSDISGLEDNTKQHYIYFYDPEYVKQMQGPLFDPHLDLGVLAGLLSQEEVDLYNELKEKNYIDLTEEEKKEFDKVKKKRDTSKTANFAITYGAYPPTISKTTGGPLEESTLLFNTYWVRNWAVEKIAEDCTVKTINYTDYVRYYKNIKNEKGEIIRREEKSRPIVKTQMWLFNPLSRFWIHLKNDKDRFSTLNQNTGVYVFDSWLHLVREGLKEIGIKVALQYHDEIMTYFKKEFKEEVGKILTTSMEEVNKRLNLNVNIKISIDYGENYAGVH